MKNLIGNKKRILLIAGLVAVSVVGTSVGVLASNGTLAGKTPAQSVRTAVNNSVKTATPSEYLNETEVKAILQDKVVGATVTKLYLEMDDGRAEYDGEMYLGKVDYDFTIEAVTGAILEWSTEVRTSSPADATSSATTTSAAITPNTATSGGGVTAIIGLEEARAAALARIPGATITKLELSRDDGKAEYEGEMYLDNVKYKFKMNAANKMFTEWQTETDTHIHSTPAAVTVKPATKTTSGSTNAYIGEAKAKQIAMTRANITNATVTELYLEYDDGHVEYDGEMHLGSVQYEFEIDAVTGTILEWDVSNDDIDDDCDDDAVDDDETDD